MKKFICIMTIAVSLMAATAQAQDSDAMVDQITEQLSSADVSEVMQAQEQIEKAKALLAQIASKQAQADKLRAEAKTASKGDAKKKNKQATAIEAPLYAQMANAYDMYEKGNTTLYGIFAHNIQELASVGPSSVQNDVADLTTFATDTWDKAAKAIKTVPPLKKSTQQQVVKIKKEINDNQLKAIRYQMEAYKFLLSVDSDGDSQEDVVLEDDNMDEAIAEEDNNSQSTSSPSGMNSETIDDEGFNFVESNNSTDRVIYKVQIAADAIPLSIAKLRAICPTDDIINNELKNGIYRYTIGYFTTYDDAKNMALTLRGKGVDGAFVVAYKNGERIKEIRDVYNNK
ncbi:MAG: SPOR domain-containing protein [Bacteroidales bacterium]|nr:SPOR domain-containing protein [Bacteroidales bacterium]